MLVNVVGSLTCFLTISLGLYVLFSNIKSRINQAFALFIISFGIWGVTLLLFETPIIFTSDFWIRITYICTTLGPIGNVFFLAYYPTKDKQTKIDRYVLLVYLFFAIFFTYTLLFTNLFVSAQLTVNNSPQAAYGFIYYVFLAIFAIPGVTYCIFRTTYRLIKSSGIAKNQLLYFLIGNTAFITSAIIFDVIIPYFFHTSEYFALSSIGLLPLAVFTTYSIIQHRLLNVRLAVIRVLERLIILLFISLPNLILIYLFFGRYDLLSHAWIFLITPFILLVSTKLVKFEPGSLLNKLLYRRMVSQKQLLAELNKSLNVATNIDTIKSITEKSIKDIFQTKYVELVMNNSGVFEHYFSFIEKYKEPVVYEELLRDTQNDNSTSYEIRTLLDELLNDRIEVIIPIENPKHVTALVLLGEKTNRSIYDTEDISLLNNLRYQISIAVENAQLVENLEKDKTLISAERNKLAMSLAGINDSVIALNINKEIVVSNPAAIKLIGDHIGKPIDEVLHLQNTDTSIINSKIYCPSEIDQSEDKIVSQLDNLKLLQTGNSSHVVRLQVSTIKEALHSDVAYILTIHDRTAEHELEVMKLDFVAMAAHELRTPLTTIRGYLSVYKEEVWINLTEEHKQMILRIENATSQLIGLMENLLSVSRIERGTLQLNIDKINWVNYVNDKIEQFKLQLKDRNIELRWEPPKDIPHVYADPARISEVLYNLLSNAAKYTNTGYVEIKIEYDSANQQVLTHITDTGQGIPASAVPHMFEKFFRVWGKLEMGSKGTGLGLYITKSIIETHGGKIWVESAGEGKGATFNFSLPAVIE